MPALLARCLLLLAAGCAARSPPAACSSLDFAIDAAFDGGAFAACTVAGQRRAVLEIAPESPPPINLSPWYAFRIEPSTSEPIEVRLEFTHGYARYWPKISADGESWRPLAAGEVTRAADNAALELSLDNNGTTRWVAAQELITAAHYRRWLAELDAHPELTVNVAGRSVEGRPIHAVVTAPRPETVVLLGRQHPPEVSGAIALRHFVAALRSDDPVARQFRDRFGLLIVPLMNPDGVARGHWRQNASGVDLNRDWGPFTQPETRAVADLLDGLAARGSAVRLMLDFHSTRSNVFYTQVPEDHARPPGFARAWLDRSRARLPGYDFEHDPRPPSGQPNAKNYFFDRYRIASITFETGDETERARIAAAAPVFAAEMMKLLLEQSPTAWSDP